MRSSTALKLFWGPGVCPGPRWESLRRSPRARSRLGVWSLLPFAPLYALGLSIWEPLALRLLPPPPI